MIPLNLRKSKDIRIRIEDEKGFITIKGKTTGVSRDEFEYEIPYNDAKKMIKLCDKTIIKKRTTVKFNKRYWVIDIFEGENKGLVVNSNSAKSEKEKFVIIVSPIPNNITLSFLISFFYSYLLI